jgi:hypothetical protein
MDCGSRSIGFRINCLCKTHVEEYDGVRKSNENVGNFILGSTRREKLNTKWRWVKSLIHTVCKIVIIASSFSLADDWRLKAFYRAVHKYS